MDQLKKIVLVCLSLCSLLASHAQKNKADSLAELLRVEKIDSNKVNLLWNMASASNIYNPDTALILAEQSVILAKKIKYTEGESRALGVLANTFLKIGNYPKGLESYLEKLKIEEKRKNPRNLCSVIMNIGIVYVYEEEYNEALSYLYKADSVITANKLTDMTYYISLNLGDVYNRLNKNDSAFFYFNRSLEQAIALDDIDLIGTSMVGMGHIYVKRNEFGLALESYRQAIRYLREADDEEMICEAAIGLAKVFEQQNISDSAEFYARYTYDLANKDRFHFWQLEASSFLTSHFKSAGKNDSALVYLEMVQALKDSISSKEMIRKSQILSSNEQIRQIQLAEEKKMAKEERKKQLEYLFVGMFIPGLFLLTVFMSKRKVNVRFVKIMSILSLLFLFEYLTILLHPRVLEWTHHKPVFEILVFVCIAAFLIPAHHRLEHWLIKKLTNNKALYSEGKLPLHTTKMKIKKPKG